MVAPLHTIAFGDLVSTLAGAWRWWTDELLGMLPARLRVAVLARLQPPAVDLQDETASVGDPVRRGDGLAARAQRPGLSSEPAIRGASPAETHPPEGAVHLRLPPQLVLRRVVDLPSAASRNLQEILRFEVERLSPIDPADVRWDWRPLGRSSAENKLQVEVWFIKQETVERALRFCESRRLIPASVGIVGEPTDVAVRRLLPSRRASMAGILKRLLLPTLLTGVALLAVLLLHEEAGRRQAEIDLLRAQVVRAKAGAQGAERLLKDIQQANARSNFLTSKKQAPMVTAVLADVTRLLPDEAWLTQFQLAEREVRIQGFAPKAAALIEVFGRSPLFANAQFRAPVTRGPRGDVERFDLSFEIRGRQ